MAYLWIKYLHILSSTLLLGTGLGIAFFMWRAHRSGDSALIAGTARTVVVADACFTAPAVVVQLLSGLWLAHRLGAPLTSFWLQAALALFFVTGACWLPVVWLQMRARDLARTASQAGRRCRPPIFVSCAGGSGWAGRRSSRSSSFSG